MTQLPKGFLLPRGSKDVPAGKRRDADLAVSSWGKKGPGTVVTQGFGVESCGHKDGLDSQGGTPNLFTHRLW